MASVQATDEESKGPPKLVRESSTVHLVKNGLGSGLGASALKAGRRTMLSSGFGVSQAQKTLLMRENNENWVEIRGLPRFIKIDSLYLAVQQAITRGQGLKEEELSMYELGSFSAVVGGRRASVPVRVPDSNSVTPFETPQPEPTIQEEGTGTQVEQEHVQNRPKDEEESSSGISEEGSANNVSKTPQPRFLVKKARTGHFWVVFCNDLVDLNAVQVHLGGTSFGHKMIHCTPLSRTEAKARGIPQGHLKIMTSRFANIIRPVALLAWAAGLPSRPLRRYGRVLFYFWPTLISLVQLLALVIAVFIFHNVSLDSTKVILNSTGSLDEEELEAQVVNSRSVAFYNLVFTFGSQLCYWGNLKQFTQAYSSNALTEYVKTSMVPDMLPIMWKKSRKLYITVYIPMIVTLAFILLVTEYCKIPELADTLFTGAGVITRVSLCVSSFTIAASSMLCHIIADCCILSSLDLSVQVMSLVGDGKSFVKLAARYLRLRCALAEMSHATKYGGVGTQTLLVCLAVPPVLLHLISVEGGFANYTVYVAFLIGGGSFAFVLIPLYKLAKAAEVLEQALTSLEKRYATAAVSGLMSEQLVLGPGAAQDMASKLRIQEYRRVHYAAFFNFVHRDAADRSLPAGFTALGVKISTSLIVQLSYLAGSGMIIIVSRLFL